MYITRHNDHRMKKLFLPFLGLLFAFETGAQITAITEKGSAVILFSNGTWRYLNDSVKVPTLDPPHYTIPVSSTAVLKGEETRYVVWYNNNKWNLLPDTAFASSEYAFEDQSGELIAIIIAERTQIPLTTVREAAINSFKKNGSECRIAEEQKIWVNGTEGLLLKIDALVDGIPVSYLNGYFSTREGTFQLITYTAYNLFDLHRGDMIELISGFVIGEPQDSDR
jgi:hypothetical protein